MTDVLTEGAAPIVLRKIAGELRTLLANSDRGVEDMGRAFEDLARELNLVLETAGAVIRCGENERMSSLLPGVHQLESAAAGFTRERLDATAQILQTVSAEEKLLQQVKKLAEGQKGIARETGMLRVLTNIEVARLGELGTGFQYLAQELNDFSRSVAQSTSELTGETEKHRNSIEQARRNLASELPRMRKEFASIQESLAIALRRVEAGLEQMRQTPMQFKICLDKVAAEVNGVIAAIQAHDITRQQMEHVHGALDMMAEGLESADGIPPAEVGAGLVIQSYQLRNARQTVELWTTQIQMCLQELGNVAAPDIVRLSNSVIDHENAIFAQLTRLEELEEACEEGDATVQASFAGISDLMQLANEHLERSASVRERLRLLMFNSIIEANRMGTQADGILSISTNIKRIASTWSEMTAQSEAATGAIRNRVEESRSTLEAFSESSYAGLREARRGTEDGLAILREAAACAGLRGQEIANALVTLQQRISKIAAARDRLQGGFARIEFVLQEIEALRGPLENGVRGVAPSDPEAIAERYSTRYTTETERAVLRAALGGEPLPAAQPSLAGNAVELF